MENVKQKELSIWGILIRLAAALAFPAFLALLLLYNIGSCLINLASKKSDEKILDDKETAIRDIDRKNKRRHSSLDLVVNYLKFIFDV